MNNESNTQQFILNHLPLVMKIAKARARRFPQLADDLICEAQLELCFIADKVMKFSKPTSYVAMRVRGRLLDLIRKQYKYKFKRIDLSDVPCRDNSSDNINEIWDQLDNRETVIVKLLEQGYKRTEIAELVGYSKARITQLLSDLSKRLSRRL